MTEKELNSLIENARILEKDSYGPKVYLNDNDVIIKTFRKKKKLFSTSHFNSPAKRFYRNSLKLQKRNITAIKVDTLCRLPHIDREAIIYQSLPGETLRNCLASNSQETKEDLIKQFAEYLAYLHSEGIYFRSIHFGNVLVQPDGSFALIDIADMKISSSSLSYSHCLRNFKAFLRYPIDTDSLCAFGMRKFVNTYLNKSDLKESIFYQFLKASKKHPLHQFLD